jgi:hypothetical protein
MAFATARGARERPEPRVGAASFLANPALFTHNSLFMLLGGFMRVARSSHFQSNKFQANNFQFRNSQLGLLLVTALSFSLLPSAGEAYAPEQQQACSGDAFRLCGPEIPDVDRVTACMVARKAELSPGCRVFFRPGPEPVTEAGAPLSIRPAARRHVAPKPHKHKKPAKPG